MKRRPMPDPKQGCRRHEAGFTLLELLVVLVILALISAFAAPRVLKYLGGARTIVSRQVV